MQSSIQNLVTRYPTMLVLIASAVIFYSGYSDMRKGKRSDGITWCILGNPRFGRLLDVADLLQDVDGLVVALAAIAIEMVVVLSAYRETR